VGVRSLKDGDGDAEVMGGFPPGESEGRLEIADTCPE
jgi:hypothetical protein